MSEVNRMVIGDWSVTGAQPPSAPTTHQSPITSFISLETASRRSGQSIGHLRRQCGDQWFSQGLAKLESPQNGGKKSWFVAEAADPSFARIKFADQTDSEFDLRTLNEKQRAKVFDRKRIVDNWQADLAAGVQLGLIEAKVTANFLQRLLVAENRTISRATLFRWSACAKDGVATLIDNRGGDEARSFASDSPFILEVQRLWLRQSRPKIKTCWDHAKLVAEDQGWETCSLKTAERRLKELPQQLVIQKRFGPMAFSNQVLPPNTRDYSTLASNQLWCADHHQFDVIVRDEQGKLVRPWITCFEDLRSRKIVGFCVFSGDPNSSTILLALRDGCLKEGVPETAYVDKGKDFDSYSLQGETKKARFARRKIKVNFDPDAPAQGGALGSLGIRVVHAIAHNAKAKPVERFFNTVCGRFSKFFATYCGRTPNEKPENLCEKLAKGLAPSIADFISRFGTWVEADYNNRVHEGDSMDDRTPNQAFADCLVTRRVARDAELQLLLQKTSRPLKCTNQGVEWDGRRYGKGDAALFPYFHKEIYLRLDPDDITRAAAYTLNDVWIADLNANVNMPHGATDAEFRRAGKEKKTIRELTKKYHQLGQLRDADVIEIMEINRANQSAIGNGQSDPPPPPSLKPVQTPLNCQSIPLRKAVGAESMSPRQPQAHKPKLIDLLAAADEMELSEREAPMSINLYSEDGA